MIDLEEYKKTATITDRNGNPADSSDCVYIFSEVKYDGKIFDVVNCRVHGHGGMREQVSHEHNHKVSYRNRALA